MRNAKLVEQAACLCSVYASACTNDGDLAAHDAVTSMRSSAAADRLACKALTDCTVEYFRIFARTGLWLPEEHWALACSMLRNGEVGR